MAKKEQGICSICKKHYSNTFLHPVFTISENLAALIKADFPDIQPTETICATDLNRYRTNYISALIKGEGATLNQLEEEVISNLEKQELYVKQLYDDYDKHLSRWDKLADKIASFGGSWNFIGIFSGFIVVWICINVFLLVQNAFDPYPFILLNLLLSCTAAIQAPVIMMSQNRMEERDRLRAENDYKINMKAEIEIKILHEKIDHLINHQWQKLLEIQQIQIELMEELKDKKN